MNETARDNDPELDVYATVLEHKIRKYQRLFDTFIQTDPDRALLLAAILDGLYSQRRETR